MNSSNNYNYDLQVFLNRETKEVLPCGHCEYDDGEPCCNANAYKGMHIEKALRRHENRMVGAKYGY
jgi:hypothetical protein